MQVAKEIFRQYDIRGVVASADAGGTLDEAVVFHLGKALGSFYHRHGVKSVSLCRDTRLSSPAFRRQLAKGLLSSGIDIYDLGMFPTPFLYFSLFHLPVARRCVVTGSHNPPNEMVLRSVWAKAPSMASRFRMSVRLWRRKTM